MSSIKYPHLFEPIRLGGSLFRNRIFASPTGHQALTLEGFVTPDVIAYYERKAVGGAAAVTVGEGVVDSRRGKGGKWHVTLDDPRGSFPLHRLTDAVMRHGAVAAVELQHAGMFANRDLSFQGASAKGPAYGPVECELDGRHILPMTEELILETIEAFADAALFAKQCGFGMVTVHGGHGWLISQFVSPFVNTRRDRWGGSVENRARLPVAIADAIHKKCGASFPVEMRISGSECHAAGYGLDEGIALARQLDGHVDLIHVSAGSHEVQEVFTVTHPSMFLEDGVNVKYAAEIKKHVKSSFVATVGSFSDPAHMEETLASGNADIIEVARQSLADPNLITKARTGREDEILQCIRCMQCYRTGTKLGLHYCSINPVTSREREVLMAPPVRFKKKVLVAGGGIAGMQAALTAAQRGHEVILCEKTDRLGGVLLCEENVPFKKHLAAYMAQQAKLISRSAIDVRLNTEVTPEYAKSLNVDVIVAALGSRPIKPAIEGIDGPNVMSAEVAYASPDKAGDNIVVIGGGLAGVEYSIYMTKLGRKVTVVELQDKLTTDESLHTVAMMTQVKELNIDIRLSTKVTKVTDKAVYAVGPDGDVVFAADTVVYATGQAPLADEAIALYDCAPEFYPVGDCIRPKNVMHATHTAFVAAYDIGVI